MVATSDEWEKCTASIYDHNALNMAMMHYNVNKYINQYWQENLPK